MFYKLTFSSINSNVKNNNITDACLLSFWKVFKNLSKDKLLETFFQLIKHLYISEDYIKIFVIYDLKQINQAQNLLNLIMQQNFSNYSITKKYSNIIQQNIPITIYKSMIDCGWKPFFSIQVLKTIKKRKLWNLLLYRLSYLSMLCVIKLESNLPDDLLFNLFQIPYSLTLESNINNGWKAIEKEIKKIESIYKNYFCNVLKWQKQKFYILLTKQINHTIKYFLPFNVNYKNKIKRKNRSFQSHYKLKKKRKCNMN